MRKPALTFLALAFAGLCAQGCADSAGRRVLAGENFSVLNQDPSKIDVLVDAVKLGEVNPNQEIKFDVATGVRRRIDFRETGGTLQFQGDWVFQNDIVLRLNYEDAPGGPNLQVENFGGEVLHVYVDGVVIGSVTPRQTQTFTVAFGTRELAFREDSDAFRTIQGDLRFANDNLVDIDFAN